MENDIYAFLKPTFIHPYNLLDELSKTKSVLFGSKALKFLFPNLEKKSNFEWDFFVPDDKFSRLSLSKHFAHYQNVRWIDDPSIGNEYEYHYDEKTGFFTQTGMIHEIVYDERIISATIRLIWLRKYHYPLECVFALNYSIDQCFITATFAVCMYKEETLKMESYYWDDNDPVFDGSVFFKENKLSTDQTVISSTKNLSKFERFIDIRYISRSSKHTGERRYIGDKKCMIIYFDREKYDRYFNRRSFDIDYYYYINWQIPSRITSY